MFLNILFSWVILIGLDKNKSVETTIAIRC